MRALEKRESGRTNKTEEKKGEKKTEEYQRNPGETRNPVAQTRGVENIRVNYKNRPTFSSPSLSKESWIISLIQDSIVRLAQFEYPQFEKIFHLLDR